MYNHKEYVKKHREDNREMYRKATKEYSERIKGTEVGNNRKKYVAEWLKRYTAKLRKEIITAYGSKCACCGETEVLFLEIDHVNNDGAKDRKVQERTFYLQIIRNNFPPIYQLLCCNCNKGKFLNKGVCPHKTRNTHTDEARRLE